jgi:hypothetical protein
MSRLVFKVIVAFIAALATFSCSEDNLIGSWGRPDKDVVNVSFDTVRVKTETVFQDSIYLRNSLAVLGQFTDPTFGSLKSDFMSQLYCPYDFEFPDDVTSIDSAYLYMYYSSWFGDSAAVHHVNVWELDKGRLDAPSSYSSGSNPADFCTMTKLLGQASFAAADFGTPDSLKELSTYQRVVRVPINISLANRFLRDNRANKSLFATPDAFTDYFKGIYVTTDYGDGSLLYVTHTELEMCYLKSVYSNHSDLTLKDSVIVGGSYFPVTKEIRQVNMVQHKELRNKLVLEDSVNYVYAPAGMFTKISIPDSLFTPGKGKLSDATINSFRIFVEAAQMEDDDWKYPISEPSIMMLIDSSRVDSFFKGFNLNDGLYSFQSTYDSQEERYVFNLGYYAQKMVKARNGESVDFTPFTTMYLIPVSSMTNASDDVVSYQHVITPAAIKVRSGTNSYSPMQIRMVYTKK